MRFRVAKRVESLQGDTTVVALILTPERKDDATDGFTPATQPLTLDGLTEKAAATYKLGTVVELVPAKGK